jgi:hypothetical protein
MYQRWMSRWLRVAAVYNAAWGAIMIVSPDALLGLLLGGAPRELLAWRAVGMMVLVYAPAYWWAAGHTRRGRPLVAVGALGKTLGAAGFLWLALGGAVPWQFGWTVLANDVIWLPAFFAFLLTCERPHLSRRSRLTLARGQWPSAPGSPYLPILGRHPRSLPTVFAAQFLAAPEAGVVSRASGRLDRVWWRPRLLGPLFGVLGRAGVLIPRSGTDVPMSLTLRPGVDQRGNPYHVCDRAIELPGSRFVTRKTFDRGLGMLVESMGPHHALQVAWDTQLRFGRALVFRQVGFGLRAGPTTVWLAPSVWRWLVGCARFVQLVATEDPSTVRIRFRLRHPGLGCCYGYGGAFRLSGGRQIGRVRSRPPAKAKSAVITAKWPTMAGTTEPVVTVARPAA